MGNGCMDILHGADHGTFRDEGAGRDHIKDCSDYAFQKQPVPRVTSLYACDGYPSTVVRVSETVQR